MQTIDLKTPPPVSTVNTTTGIIQRNDTIGKLEALEEKIDLVLKYQKQTRRLTIIRTTIDFIFIFIFVILPILGSVYLFSYINKKFDLEKVRSQFTDFQDNIENLRKKSDQIDNLTDMPNLFNR